MKFDTDTLKEILIKESYVSEDDMSTAIDFADKHHSDPIDYLIEQELIDKNTITQAMAEFYKLPFIDLEEEKPSKDLVQKLPQEIAEKFRIILFSETDGGKYATDAPGDKKWLDELTKTLKVKKVNLYYADTCLLYTSPSPRD